MKSEKLFIHFINQKKLHENKKVYNEIIKSTKVYYNMDTIFMNSENSRTSKYNVLMLKLIDKLDLRSSEKSIALSNLSIYYTWKNIKSS